MLNKSNTSRDRKQESRGFSIGTGLAIDEDNEGEVTSWQTGFMHRVSTPA